jgi:MFS family permease
MGICVFDWFDIWLILPFAIIPQIFISVTERKQKQFKTHIDTAINAVWLTYAITILGLVVYQNIIPGASITLAKADGWQMMKHYLDGSQPDAPVQPSAPSIYSIYILIYAIPTLVTGIAKNHKPMLVGACITYILFVISCFTASKYDMLLGGAAALVCWFIPGIILRKKFMAQKQGNV